MRCNCLALVLSLLFLQPSISHFMRDNDVHHTSSTSDFQALTSHIKPMMMDLKKTMNRQHSISSKFNHNKRSLQLSFSFGDGECNSTNPEHSCCQLCPSPNDLVTNRTLSITSDEKEEMYTCQELSDAIKLIKSECDYYSSLIAPVCCDVDFVPCDPCFGDEPMNTSMVIPKDPTDPYDEDVPCSDFSTTSQFVRDDTPLCFLMQTTGHRSCGCPNPPVPREDACSPCVGGETMNTDLINPNNTKSCIESAANFGGISKDDENCALMQYETFLSCGCPSHPVLPEEGDRCSFCPEGSSVPEEKFKLVLNDTEFDTSDSDTSIPVTCELIMWFVRDLSTEDPFTHPSFAANDEDIKYFCEFLQSNFSKSCCVSNEEQATTENEGGTDTSSSWSLFVSGVWTINFITATFCTLSFLKY